MIVNLQGQKPLHTDYDLEVKVKNVLRNIHMVGIKKIMHDIRLMSAQSEYCVSQMGSFNAVQTLRAAASPKTALRDHCYDGMQNYKAIMLDIHSK